MMMDYVLQLEVKVESQGLYTYPASAVVSKTGTLNVYED